jgi:hypothetical protein
VVNSFLKPAVISVPVALATAADARVSVAGVVAEVSRHKNIDLCLSLFDMHTV